MKSKIRKKLGLYCGSITSLDIIVRYSMGEVLATLSKSKDYIIEPDIAEAKVALRLRVVQFCRKLSFYRVALECDTL